MDLTPIARISVKEQVLQQLKQYIVAGGMLPGEKLPSERELAERLGIGRTSVREALKVLEAIGLVESRIGDGTFITANVGASIGHTIGLSLMTWGGTIVEILEARRMIESEAARAAAERATVADLAAIGAELDTMAGATDFQAYLKADMQFHRAIGQATHNTIVTRIINNLLDLLEEVLREAHGDELMTSAEGNSTHRAVYAALQARDPAGAATAMAQHITFATELWQAIISLSTVAKTQ